MEGDLDMLRDGFELRIDGLRNETEWLRFVTFSIAWVISDWEDYWTHCVRL